eukprot:TRINITY_DN5669_c0_g1_i1.p1 TRINITY_DN5669_c0_g1~~TRINITY_DN5669_c0_g1_i1.p1  ORF type:complete len:204 (-),score=34.23 TRINITY_DN5669_c0_g1_i1:300-875(-)
MANWEHEWKLITIYIGGNDVFTTCENINGPKYGENVAKALDILQELPKTYVALVGVPDFTQLYDLMGNDFSCGIWLGTFTSGCSFSPKQQKDMIGEFNSELKKLADNGKYQREDFTVEYFPAVENIYEKVRKNMLSIDCFHFTAKSQGVIAENLWNNLFESRGSRSQGSYGKNEEVTCPTSPAPYLTTFNN